MDFCDKWGKDIDTLEPCLKIQYGFMNEDDSYGEMGYILVHVDCFTDVDALSRILNNFEKH